MKRFCRQIIALLTALLMLPGLFAVPAEEYVEYSNGFSVWAMRSSNMPVRVYVSINDEWTYIGETTTVVDSSLYSVPVANVEALLGGFGFTEEMYDPYEGEFAYAADDSIYVKREKYGYAATMVRLDWSTYSSVTSHYNLYYMPVEGVIYTNSTVDVNTLVKANSFYSITVEGVADSLSDSVDFGGAYSNNGQHYVAAGDSAAVTLPVSVCDGIEFSGTYGSVTYADADGKRTYTFSNVQSAVTLSVKARNAFNITLVDEYGITLGTVNDIPMGTSIAEWVVNNDKLVLDDGSAIHDYMWSLPNDTPITNQTVNGDITIIGKEKQVCTVTFIGSEPGIDEEGGFLLNDSADYNTVQVLQGDTVPADFFVKMNTNVRPNEGYAFVEWRYAGNDGYLVLDENSAIVSDTVVWAAYTQKVYVRFWTGSDMQTPFASAGIEDQPVGKMYAGAVPSPESIEAAAPAEGMRFRYWVDINSGEVFTIDSDQVKGNLDLYPVYERAIYEFKDSDGFVYEVLYDGSELFSEEEEREGWYFAGLNALCNDSSYALLTNGTVITREFLLENNIALTGPENGRYTVSVEPVYRQERRIVYHTGDDAQFIIYGAEELDEYTVVIEDHAVLLGPLDIVNNRSPIGLALDGWTTVEGSSVAQFDANMTFDGEAQLDALTSAGGTVHLYPVWAQQADTVAVTFVSNYPADAVDEYGNPLAEKSYTIYIKTGSKPSMPTRDKAKIDVPANRTGDTNRYLLAGWALDEDGSLSTSQNTAEYGTYTEGSQYAYGIYQNTTFHAIWVDVTAPQTGITAYFFIRTDGKLPIEPGQFENSGYLPSSADCTTSRAWAGTIKKPLNVVNNVFEVEANILTEPNLETILSGLQSNSAYVQDFPQIKNMTVADYGTLWWIDWYACKNVYCMGVHYHVDGRVRFATDVELNYHPNGGENVPAGKTYTKNTSADVDFSKTPTRENFIFVGWDEDPSAKVPDYPVWGVNFPTSPNLSNIYMDADKDLYAIWQPIQITIPLDDDFRGMKYEQTNENAPTPPRDGRTYQFSIEAISLPEGAMPYEKRIVTSAADGTFSFPRANVSVAGMYVFEVREVVGNLPVQYDTSVYRLTINIVESDYGLGIAGYSFTRNNEMMVVNENNVDNIVFEFTNRTDVRNITAAKRWNDGDDQDGMRPDSVTVTLRRRGDSVFYETAELSRANGWAYEWEGLPIKDSSSGYMYEYYIEESPVAGYTAVYSGDMNSGFTVTNVHAPLTTAINVVKVWNDNNDAEGYRPDSIEYTVTGTTPDGNTVLVKKSGDVVAPWSHSFTDLPVYYMGERISYTLTESKVPGYTATIESIGGTSTVRVTNTLGAKSFTVTKYVAGNAAHRDEEFTFTARVYDNYGNLVTGLEAGDGYEVNADGVITFKLSHGRSVNIDMLPARGYIVISEDAGTYTPEWTEGGTVTNGGIRYSLADFSSVSVTNHRNASVSTGIRLDRVPFLIMAFIAMAGIALLCRKRREA